jgi:5-formyltetrahydrofolate cyclo-ligase
MTKKEIRRFELQKRIQLTAQELENKTEEIILQFNNLTLPTVNYLLSYHPLKEHNEFNVATCDQIIREKYPAVNIAWPRILFNTAMEAVLAEKDKLFIKNKYNILEPVDGTFVSPHLIDIIFVPLVSFDKNGYRVGYGKGFYDRYLPLCREDTLKIGFSFFEARDKIDDINEFDVPLNLCITPTCIYEF